MKLIIKFVLEIFVAKIRNKKGTMQTKRVKNCGFLGGGTKAPPPFKVIVSLNRSVQACRQSVQW